MEIERNEYLEKLIRKQKNGLVTIGIHNFLLDKDSLRL